MKKVFMWGEIILIAIMGAVLLAGCGDKKDDKKKDNKVNNDTNVSSNEKVDNNNMIAEDENGKYIVTFKDNNNAIKYDEDYSSITFASGFDCEKYGVMLSAYVEEVSKDKVDMYKQSKIKEYTWNGYNGFTYDDNSNTVKYYVVLKEDGDKVIALAGGLNYMLDANETTDLNSAFEQNEIQDFLNTMELKK